MKSGKRKKCDVFGVLPPCRGTRFVPTPAILSGCVAIEVIVFSVAAITIVIAIAIPFGVVRG
jgi:hypothetical protein